MSNGPPNAKDSAAVDKYLDDVAARLNGEPNTTIEPDELVEPDEAIEPVNARDDEPPPPQPVPDLEDIEEEDDDEDGEKPKQAEKLVRLMLEAANLFHAPGRTKYDFYVDVNEGGVRQTHSIGSSTLNRWMLKAYRARNGQVLGQSVIDSANGMLRALAEDGPEMDVGVRTAQHGGNYFIDLADPRWRAVKVTPNGWDIAKSPPVRFSRGSSMLPLPVPEKGGDLLLLREFLNLKDDDSFLMVVAWLLAALRPVGPYPILVINGEQGSAKSTASRILRSLVDPSTALLRHASASDRDLFISASKSWVLAFDNCSRLPGWLSDALCRLATGGGFATRALYTDTDEVVFNAKRPVILNGITEFVERGDLADRSVFVHLTPIPKTERKTEKEVLGEFERVRPLIFGGLLDAMVTGLRMLPSTKLTSSPRMAEFATWAVACESEFTVEDDDFLDAYGRNQATAVAAVVEADPVATAIQELAYRRHEKGQGEWEGNATTLLEELDPIAGEKVTKQRSWPKSAAAMGKAVARVGPVLRQAGVPIERPNRTGAKRLIVIGTTERPKERTVLDD